MTILGFVLGYVIFALFLTGMVRHGAKVDRLSAVQSRLEDAE